MCHYTVPYSKTDRFLHFSCLLLTLQRQEHKKVSCVLYVRSDGHGVTNEWQHKCVRIVIKNRYEASKCLNGHNNRFSSFFSSYNQAAGLFLSWQISLAHWNCVTVISYNTFLTLVHPRIQPAQPYHPPPHPSKLNHLYGRISVKSAALIFFGISVLIYTVGLWAGIIRRTP